MGITQARSVIIVFKLRSSLHKKIEKLVMVWVTKKQLKGHTLTQGEETNLRKGPAFTPLSDIVRQQVRMCRQEAEDYLKTFLD